MDNETQTLKYEIPEVFSGNICYIKSKEFAVDIALICRRIAQQKDYVVTAPYLTQLVRSSSSVLANLSEGTASSSISDKERALRFSISVREAHESISWIGILYELGEITVEEKEYYENLAMEIIKILTKSISTIKAKKKI